MSKKTFKYSYYVVMNGKLTMYASEIRRLAKNNNSASIRVTKLSTNLIQFVVYSNESFELAEVAFKIGQMIKEKEIEMKVFNCPSERIKLTNKININKL